MSKEKYNLNTCPECGTSFSTECCPGWYWKNIKGDKVCSYHCQRKSEKNSKNKPDRRVKRVPVRIVETGEVFDSITKCADSLGATYSKLHRCVYNGETYKKMHIERVV